MKIEERIIRYFDNQMDELEKKKFEEDLKNSPSLNMQVEYYKNVLQKLKIKDESLTEEDYFINLVPRFREKLSAQKHSRPTLKIAYSLSAVVLIMMIALFYFNPFKTKDNLTLENLISSFDEQEKLHILKYYESDTELTENSNEYSTEYLYDMFLKEINLQDSDIAKMDAYGNLSMEEIITHLQENEVDAIYDKILNTKFF